MSDLVEVGSPPDETSALLMAGILTEAGPPIDEQQGAGFSAHTPLSAVSGDVLLPDEPALRQLPGLPEHTVGLGSW